MITSRRTFDDLMHTLPDRQAALRRVNGDWRYFYRQGNTLEGASAGGGWVRISRSNLPPTPVMAPPVQLSPPRPPPAPRSPPRYPAGGSSSRGLGLFLEQSLEQPLAATAAVANARADIAYDIRVSSCPIDAGPRLGMWLLAQDCLYIDARRLFDMSPRQLQATVATGYAPNQAGREAIGRRTGIALLSVRELDLDRDMAASNRNRPAAREFGDWLAANGLRNYAAAEAELGVSAASISRAVLTGYASPAVQDRIYEVTGIFLDD